MMDSDSLWQPFLPQLRLGVRLCVAGLLVAYALLLTLKGYGILPDHVSWLGCFVVPAVLFSFLGSLFAFPLWLRERWWLGFLPFALLCCGCLLALLRLEQGRAP